MKRKQPTLSNLKAKAWALFSQYIRRRAADEGGTVECVTCGRLMFWKESHAGHAIPGRGNAVLFDEDIVHPQCPPCNRWRGGMYHIYSTKLIKQHGMDWWESKLAGARQSIKWTRADMEERIAIYKQKLAGLS